MANIHRIGDLNNDANDAENQRRQGDNQDDNVSSMNDLFEEPGNFTPGILVAC